MRTVFALIASLWLAGCAQLPPAESPEPLLADERFAAPSQPIDPQAVFALSAPMRDHLRSEIVPRARQRSLQHGLAQALYQRGDLRLDYDASFTRTAAQAFDARAGNCLSLVIMTAAFAKALDLRVEYHAVLDADTWSRQGDLYLHSGHVNLTLGRRTVDHARGLPSASVTIDFLPQDDAARLRSRQIDEATVLAMYMNNRAAELLTEGRLDDAYWHAREAVLQDPGFASAFNTLAVIYLRHHDLAHAEQALRRAMATVPDNPRPLANLVSLLDRQGRDAEAAPLREQLARLEPDPPGHWFGLGRAAADEGRWSEARELFRREARRADFDAELHHWLALAHWRLGDVAAARRELALAVHNSTTGADRDRYAAKLARLAERVPATP